MSVTTRQVKISAPPTAVAQQEQEPFMMCSYAIKRLTDIKHMASGDF